VQGNAHQDAAERHRDAAEAHRAAAEAQFVKANPASGAAPR
jgi:hypothetical protein